jgi:phosphatidylserine/phosphatidylglycerophosphate/cardiolipin synthase-like enzyme
MVIDNRIVVAGSFNYTASANEYNDGNLVVIDFPHAEVESEDIAPFRVPR